MLNDLYSSVRGMISTKSGNKQSRNGNGHAKITDKNNVESELTPMDFEDLPDMGQDPKELAILNMTRKKFRAAAMQRYIHEKEWLICTGFDRGNQFIDFREASTYPEMLMDPNNPNRSYITANLIGNSIVPKLVAYATMTQPDAKVRPLTRRQIDVMAAAEARDILHHYDAKYGQKQMMEWVDSVLTMSTSFLKVYWNPHANALVAYSDPQVGMKVKSAAVGDICRVVVPPFEMYPDAAARSWDYCRHVTQAKRMPLSWFQETFGDRGRMVRPDSGTAVGNWATWWETNLDAIAGELYRTGNIGTEDTAFYMEYWEKPTPRYPLGRMIPYSNDLVLVELDELDWPYDAEDPLTGELSFPFVPLGFRNKFGTMWALNAVHDAIPLQRMVNEELSRMSDMLECERPTILKVKGSKVKYNDTQDRRLYAEIEYEQGMPPTYAMPPPVGAHRFQYLTTVIGILEDITAIHDVSKATIPPNLDSGVAINLARESDTTALKSFLTNIERACQDVANLEIQLAAQFYDEPRMMAVSQANSDDDAVMDIRSFESLTAGGKCRVEIVPGSAVYQSPDTKIQRWMDILKSGALSNPANIPALLAIFDQIGFELSDTMAQNLRSAIQEMMQITQSIQGSPQQQQAAQQAHEQFMLAMQGQLEQMKASIAAQYNMQVENARAQTDILIAKFETMAKTQEQQAEFAAKLALQERDKAVPSTSIAAKLTLGSTAGPSAEEMMGLKPDAPEEVQSIVVPPKPTEGEGDNGGEN